MFFGRKHNRGTEYDPFGNKLYEGDYHLDKFHGDSCRVFRDGRTFYVGQMKFGFPDGYGKIWGTDSSNLKYTGRFELGQPEDSVGKIYHVGKWETTDNFSENDEKKQKDVHPRMKYCQNYVLNLIDSLNPTKSTYKGMIKWHGGVTDGYDKNGFGIEYHSNGKVMSRGKAKDDIIYGDTVYVFHPNGMIQFIGKINKDMSHEGKTFGRNGKLLRKI